MKIIYSLEARNKLSRLLDDRDIAAAHVHSIYHHLSPSVLVELRSRGIPTIMTAHDLKLACPNNKMLNQTGICERCKGGHVWNAVRYRCIKQSFAASGLIALESAIHKSLGLYRRYIDRVVAPSRFYREKLISWGFDPAWIVHIPNVVHLPTEPISPPGDYYIYFGRLAHEKGLETLIRAAAGAKTPVKLVGSGPMEGALKALAQSLSAPVEFLGFMSGQPLWSIVRGARAVILPSEWYENGPMSVIEAFGHGKPLIGADIGGIPELISCGSNGWLFESGNIDELRDVLISVSTMSIHRLEMMGEAARSYVEKSHSENQYYESMCALYAR